MKLPLAPLVGLVALLVACCSAQLSSDYLGMYNDYDLYGQGYGAEGYGQDYEDQPSDQKNSWNPYSAYYGDEYGDYFFKDPAEVAQDCTVGADGKVTFAGTAACDVKLSGADQTVPNLNGGLDGVYTVTACESGRPLYTREKSPKNEDRVLWYSTMFRDWDVTNGTAPKNDDVLMYGGRGGEETRPQFVLTDWHVASEFMKDFNGFEEYSKVDLQVECADGSKSEKPGELRIYQVFTLDVACFQGMLIKSSTTVFGRSPLLTDDELDAQYSSVYQRAKSRPSPVSTSTFVVAGLFGVMGLGIVFGVPYLLARARLGKKSV